MPQQEPSRLIQIQDSYTTADRATFTPGGPLRVSWRDRYISHPEAGSYRGWQRGPDNIPTSPGPSEGRTDASERAGHEDLHSLSNRAVGNVGRLLKSPQNLRLYNLPDQPAVVRPRKGKRAKRTMGPAEAAHARKCNFRESMAQVSF